MRPAIFLLLMLSMAAAAREEGQVLPSLYSTRYGAAAKAPDLLQPGIDEGRRKLRPSYSPHREHKARILLTMGGVFLAAGTATIVYAATAAHSSAQGSGHDNGLLYVGVLGAYSTAAGLGLSIPGAVLLRKNHARRRELVSE